MPKNRLVSYLHVRLEPHEKKVIDMGPVQVEHKETSRVPVSPFLGGFAIVAGIILVAVGNKANTSLL